MKNRSADRMKMETAADKRTAFSKGIEERTGGRFRSAREEAFQRKCKLCTSGVSATKRAKS